jgi:phospholipase C
VNFIVNTVGKSSYWGATTIVVVWDDWGGWYDHVVPFHTPSVYPQYYNLQNWTDPYEYGYRVPMLVISPYLRAPTTVDHYPFGYSSSPPRTQASILAYVEQALGLGSLNAADSVSDNLSEMFNYNRTPIKFQQADPTAGFPSSPGDCTDGGNEFNE